MLHLVFVNPGHIMSTTFDTQYTFKKLKSLIISGNNMHRNGGR